MPLNPPVPPGTPTHVPAGVIQDPASANTVQAVNANLSNVLNTFPWRDRRIKSITRNQATDDGWTVEYYD